MSLMCGFLFALILSFTAALETTKEPIVIGTFPAYSSSDFLIRQVANPAFDAIRASVLAVNRGGGISGRPLQLVECESALVFSRMMECAANMTRDHPTMLAWAGIFTDLHMDYLKPIIEANQLLVVGPTLITNRHRSNFFTADWIFTSSEPQSRFLLAISTIVQRFHVRRVGIIAETVLSSVSGDLFQFDLSAAQKLMTYRHR